MCLFWLTTICILLTGGEAGLFVQFARNAQYQAAAWAIIGFLIALVSSFVCYLRSTNQLNDWYSQKELRSLSYLGCLTAMVAITGIAYNSAEQYQNTNEFEFDQKWGRTNGTIIVLLITSILLILLTRIGTSGTQSNGTEEV